MWYFQPSSGLCCSLSSTGLSPILGQRLWLFTLPQAQPLWLGPAARHAWGAWRPSITNSSSQATGLPTPTYIYPPQTNTLHSSHSRQVFFFFLPLFVPTIPLHSCAKYIFSFLLPPPPLFLVRRKKNEGSDGSHFSSTFLFSLTSHFLALPPLPSPILDVCVWVRVCFSPMVERQPKCERDGCQSPFLSPKAPCLCSLLCRARLHLHIVI